MHEPIQDVQNPITSSSSIVGIKYNGGILLASDRAVSYGSCFKFSNVSHFHRITPKVVIGCSGEMSDFQELVNDLTYIVRDYQCKNNGDNLSPLEISNYIKRLMYTRRSHMEPFVMRCVLAGVDRDGSLHLTSTDMFGTQWEDDYVTTGMSAHIKGTQLMDAANKTREEAYQALKDVFVGLVARHMLMTGRIEFVDVTDNGVKFEEPVEIKANWDIIDANKWD